MREDRGDDARLTWPSRCSAHTILQVRSSSLSGHIRELSVSCHFSNQKIIICRRRPCRSPACAAAQPCRRGPVPQNALAEAQPCRSPPALPPKFWISLFCAAQSAAKTSCLASIRSGGNRHFCFKVEHEVAGQRPRCGGLRDAAEAPDLLMLLKRLLAEVA